MLRIRRLEGEAWRDCAARYGRAQGLEAEVLAWYDAAIHNGLEPAQAAFGAVAEWDCTDYVPPPPEGPKNERAYPAPPAFGAVALLLAGGYWAWFLVLLVMGLKGWGCC